ncbi:hypothetical protein LY78DRAFT_285660 [Colletotrichum sublineola]|nr:hypothetical protein LY78DRAFT_285660 [Colletotrichum sublineola]
MVFAGLLMNPLAVCEPQSTTPRIPRRIKKHYGLTRHMPGDGRVPHLVVPRDGKVRYCLTAEPVDSMEFVRYEYLLPLRRAGQAYCWLS